MEQVGQTNDSKSDSPSDNRSNSSDINSPVTPHKKSRPLWDTTLNSPTMFEKKSRPPWYPTLNSPRSSQKMSRPYSNSPLKPKVSILQLQKSVFLDERRKEEGNLGPGSKKSKRCEQGSLHSGNVAFSEASDSSKHKQIDGNMTAAGRQEELDSGYAEFNDSLDKKARRVNMSAKNVKSLIHHIIKSEQVASMLKDIVEPQHPAAQPGISSTRTSSPVFGVMPTMTRAKVKEMLQKMPSPVKLTKEGPSILDLEFTEEDDDDEYNPERDEESHDSDDDSILSSRVSELGSPYVPATPQTPSVVENFVLEDHASKAVKEKVIGDTDCDHEVDLDRSMQLSVVVDPLDGYDGQVDTIALRTRSKLPLTTTSLTDIESAFVAPDITRDMYDIPCEDADWLQFLSSLYKTADDTVTDDDADANDPEFNYIAEAEREQLDEEDFRFDKPTQITKKEMTALINELSDLFEDEVLPYQVMASASQKTTTRKTPDAQNSTTDFTNPTMISAGSGAEMSFTELRDFDTTRTEATGVVLRSDTGMGAPPLASISVVPDISNSTISQCQASSSPSHIAFTKFKVPDVPVRPLVPIHFSSRQVLQQNEIQQSSSMEYTYQNSELDADMIVTPDLKALIEDNLRKHIQLLLQSYLLCLNNRHERHASSEFKSLLEELYGLSTTLVSGADSILDVCNLEPAIRVVYDSSLMEGAEIRTSVYTEPRCVLTPVQKLAVCNSPAFVYPHFLPCLRKPKKSNRKYNTFTPHEDNLIALGLHNFQSCQNVSPVELIYELLIRGKSMEQIFYRIQYMSSGRVEDNPIKSVKKTGSLPSTFPEPVFDHFYPTAPKDQSSDQLPTWVTSMKQSFTQGILEPLNGIKFSQAKTRTGWSKPDNSKFILPNIGGLQPSSGTETSYISASSQEFVNERHVAPLTPSPAYNLQPQDYQVLTVPSLATNSISADIPQITGIFIQFDSSISKCFPSTFSNNTPASTFHKFMNQETTRKVRTRTKRKACLSGGEKKIAIKRSYQLSKDTTTSVNTTSTQTEDICSSSLSPDLLAKTMLSCGIEEPDSCSSVTNTNQDVDILDVSQQQGESSVSSHSVPEDTSSPSNSYSASGIAVNSEVNKSVFPMENPVDSKNDNQSSNEVSSSCIPASSTVQTTSTRKTIRQIYQALANSSHKTEQAQPSSSKPRSDCSTTRMVNSLLVSNTATGCGVLPDFCKANSQLQIDPLQVEADSPGQDLVQLDSTSSSENTEAHLSPADSVESSSCLNLDLPQNKTPFSEDASNKTEVSPVTTPTKLRPLVAKTIETSGSPPYIPLPKYSPGKKKLQSQVRQILPKSFLFGIKSSSPTKAAAQHLKRRAAYYCQNRSPIKILPKFAGVHPGSSAHKVSSSVVNKLFRPPSTVSRRHKECKKSSNTSKGLEEAYVAGQIGVMEMSKTEVDESELSQEEEDQCQLDDLMAACTTIGYDPNKGNTSCSDTDYKTKAQKKREMCLSMLEPDIVERDPRRDARDTAYAQHYFNHLKQVLSDDPGRFKKFLSLLHDMNKNHMNPIELYADLATLIPDHQALVEDFAGFLLSYQAVECNCFLPCQEYQQILTFLRRLEICCDSSTWMFQRTLKMMSKWVMMLNQDSNVDVAPLREKIGTLVRHVPSVMDDLLSYFFGTPLPDSHYEDYEEVDLKDDTVRAVDEFEEVTLPESWDSYNTKLCTCPCHQDEQDEKLRGRIKHCSSCSLKIFDGQPVLNTSRNVYRPITVLYPAEEKEKKMRAKKEAAQLALAKARAQKRQNKKKGKNVNPKHGNRRPLKNKLGRLKKTRLVQSTVNDTFFNKNVEVQESRLQLDGEKCNSQSNCEVGQDPFILNEQRLGVQAEICDDDHAASAGVVSDFSDRLTHSAESSCSPQENLLADDVDFRPVGVLSIVVADAPFCPRSYDSDINGSNLNTSQVVSEMETLSPDNAPRLALSKSPDSHSSGFSPKMCQASCSSSSGRSGDRVNPMHLEGKKDQTEQVSSDLSHHSCGSLQGPYTSESCITNSKKSSHCCHTNDTVSTPDQMINSRQFSYSEQQWADRGTATMEHNAILSDVSSASKKLSTKYEVSGSPVAEPSNDNQSSKESRTSALSVFSNLETSQATVDSLELETWSEEDDRTILDVITVDGDTKGALALLATQIQDRTLDQIKNRARLLLEMLDQMTDTESDSAVEEF